MEDSNPVAEVVGDSDLSLETVRRNRPALWCADYGAGVEAGGGGGWEELRSLLRY